VYSPRRVELWNVRKLIALFRILLDRDGVGVTTLILLLDSWTTSAASSMNDSTMIGTSSDFSTNESVTQFGIFFNLNHSQKSVYGSSNLSCPISANPV